MMKPFKSRQELILWLCVLIYIAIFITLSCLRHKLFLTQTWDLGAFTQMFWRATHGLGFGTPIEQAANHLGVHMSPFLYVLIPGYWLFQSPVYLLVLQTFALAIGAIPLFYIGKLLLPESKWPLIVAIAYLCYPSLHWINLFDFHEVPFFIPLVFTAVYFFFRQRWWWSGIFFILAASVSENSIVAISALALYLAFCRLQIQTTKPISEKQQWWFGLGVFLISIAYFVVAVKILMPAAGGGFFRIDRYAQFGNSLTEVAVNMVTKPSILFSTIWQWSRLQYLVGLFLPVLILPFFSGWGFITLIPGLAQNVLSTFGFQTSSFYQYDATLLPALWLTVLIGLRHPWIAKIRDTIWFRWVFWVAIALTLMVRSPLNPFSLSSLLSQPAERQIAYRDYISLVPDNASVTAPTNLIPHLSNRQYAFMLGHQQFDTDIVIVDTHDYFGFDTQEAFIAYVQGIAQSGKYEVGKVADGYLLLYRKGIKLQGTQ